MTERDQLNALSRSIESLKLSESSRSEVLPKGTNAEAESDRRPEGNRPSGVRRGRGGFLCGGLIGGVGGRLAMFLLRVTSGPAVMGVESDDGFVIGPFTSSTGFLILFTAALGLVGGLIYTVARGWLPNRFRPHIMAGLFALVGGALIVDPNGVDFTLIKPHSLAIGLFVLLPGLYGYYVAKAVDRLLDRPPGRFAPWVGIVLVLVPVVFMGTGANGLGGILVALLVVGWLVGRRIQVLRVFLSSVWVTWLGATVLVLIGGASAVILTKDVLEIL